MAQAVAVALAVALAATVLVLEGTVVAVRVADELGAVVEVEVEVELGAVVLVELGAVVLVELGTVVDVEVLLGEAVSVAVAAGAPGWNRVTCGSWSLSCGSNSAFTCTTSTSPILCSSKPSLTRVWSSVCELPSKT
jgi:hypothetical protein